MKNKKGSAWIWILVIIILVAVGIGLYIWLSGGGDTSPVVNAGTNAGVSSGGALPQPPALPSG